MKQSKVYQMALAAMIAAMYAAVSLALAPISFGTVQLRIAEEIGRASCRERVSRGV